MLAYQKLAALVGVLFLMAVGLSACDNAAQEEAAPPPTEQQSE